MHCGKKWWIREFVAPYIFPLNPDYVAARSLRSLRSNNLCGVENDENEDKKGGGWGSLPSRVPLPLPSFFLAPGTKAKLGHNWRDVLCLRPKWLELFFTFLCFFSQRECNTYRSILCNAPTIPPSSPPSLPPSLPSSRKRSQFRKKVMTLW